MGQLKTYGDKIQEVANGVCETKKTDSLCFKIKNDFEKLSIVITTYKPNHAAVENTFVNKDATNTLKLGQARGVSILARR